MNRAVYFGSIAILALCFVFTLGYNIANPIAGEVISFAVLIVYMNQNASFDFLISELNKADLSAMKDILSK